MRMLKTAIAGVLCVLGFASAAVAQIVVNPLTARAEFLSPDQTAVIPPGQVGAGGPAIASYQAMVFSEPIDVSTGVPVWTSPVIPKSSVTALGTATPQVYSLTFFQMGITTATLGPCTAVAPTPCPAYTILLVDIGPGGTSARAVTSESDSFSWAALVNPPPAAPPSAVKIKGS